MIILIYIPLFKLQILSEIIASEDLGLTDLNYQSVANIQVQCKLVEGVEADQLQFLGETT